MIIRFYFPNDRGINWSEIAIDYDGVKNLYIYIYILVFNGFFFKYSGNALSKN